VELLGIASTGTKFKNIVENRNRKEREELC
jgi:hypothetical protein